MRIARYRSPTGGRVGLVADDQIYDLANLMNPAPVDVVQVLAGGVELWASLEATLESAEPLSPIGQVELLAPIPRPGKFFGVGNNSPSHLAEIGTDTPSRELVTALASLRLVQAAYPSSPLPLVFNKQTSSISGPFDPIWIPRDAPTVDFEGELALVIGSTGRRLSVEEAETVIAGYLVANDVSVREWQIASPLVWSGKSFDTHGPIGPWVTTADEIAVDDLRVRTWVNEELRQDGTTAEWIYGPAAVVSSLSQFCTLEPGDIISMGTPAGVGIVDGRYLRSGDSVTVEVEGLGRISNSVVDEPKRGTHYPEEYIMDSA